MKLKFDRDNPFDWMIIIGGGLAAILGLSWLAVQLWSTIILALLNV